MMAILEEGLEDLSISRTNFDWGIPVPGPSTGSGQAAASSTCGSTRCSTTSRQSAGARTRSVSTICGPRSMQLIGKEIARFHTIIWPAMLWALGEAAPELVFAHGWITRRRSKDRQEPRQRGRSVRARRTLRRRFAALFSAARSAVRQRLLVLRREDRAAPQQRSRQRSRQSRSAFAFDVAKIPRLAVVPQRSQSGEFAGRFSTLPERVRASDPLARIPRRARIDVGSRYDAQPRDRRTQTVGACQRRPQRRTRRVAVRPLRRVCAGLPCCSHPVMPERMRRFGASSALNDPIATNWSEALRVGQARARNANDRR